MEQYIEGKDGKERSFRVAVEPGYGGQGEELRAVRWLKDPGSKDSQTAEGSKEGCLSMSDAMAFGDQD